ncbi:hypothetical protein HDV00_009287 [Rhizophlyctis rosea]|nr:hypothetical protein HDV00_009287 [Rhizophlyctis rosea]
MTTIHDVLIIGAGPGGLSCAGALARQLRSTAVVDSGVYRNARATHMHNYLGFDHVPPSQLRAKGRQDLLARYQTTTFVDREVLSIAKIPTTTTDANSREAFIFKAVDSASESHYGRAVVLATGVKDVFPEIPGFADCWGRGIFHCLFCHGYEERGAARAGVLTGGMCLNAKMAMHFTIMAKQLASTVTIYTNGDEGIAAEAETLVAGKDYLKVDKRRIVKVEMADPANGDGTSDHGVSDIVLHFDQGESVREGFLAHAPKTKVNGPWEEQLGIGMADNGMDFKTINMFNESTVPGVYIAGDCGVNPKAVVTAAASGAMVAGGMTPFFDAQPANLVIPK